MMILGCLESNYEVYAIGIGSFLKGLWLVSTIVNTSPRAKCECQIFQQKKTASQIFKLKIPLFGDCPTFVM